MISHDPDLVIFTGDQIYENDYGSPVFHAKTKEEVPQGMKNYLEKYRKFGEAFRELMRDRPTVMITDDHDVFLPDLWGNGAVLIDDKRTTGGYPAHPDWVNAAEFTQTGHLPDPVNPGPHGDGIKAFYTALEYGGVRFAILEDRKWKSPPSEVLTEQIVPPGYEAPASRSRTHTDMEVVLDPDYDCTQLDDPGLQLLGPEQEAFLADWSADLKASGQIEGRHLRQTRCPCGHVFTDLRRPRLQRLAPSPPETGPSRPLAMRQSSCCTATCISAPSVDTGWTNSTMVRSLIPFPPSSPASRF